MPLLITYRGQPVKRRFRLGSRLKLIFFAPTPGHPGERLLITQQEWQQHGRVQFVTPPGSRDGHKSSRP
jgi:hypothetical protein